MQVFLPDLVTPSSAYLPSDTLTTTLWPGDDLPALCTPSTSWTDATVAKFSIDFVPGGHQHGHAWRLPAAL